MAPLVASVIPLLVTVCGAGVTLKLVPLSVTDTDLVGVDLSLAISAIGSGVTAAGATTLPNNQGASCSQL